MIKIFIKLTCAFTGSDLLINLDRIELIEKKEHLTKLYYNYDENDYVEVQESYSYIEVKLGRKLLIGK